MTLRIRFLKQMIPTQRSSVLDLLDTVMRLLVVLMSLFGLQNLVVILCLTTRAETYAEQDLKQKVDELSAAGRWSLIEQSPIFQSYYLVEPDVTSQVFVYQVNKLNLY